MRDVTITINEKQYVLVKEESVGWCDECALYPEYCIRDNKMCDLGIDNDCEHNINLRFIQK